MSKFIFEYKLFLNVHYIFTKSNIVNYSCAFFFIILMFLFFGGEGFRFIFGNFGMGLPTVNSTNLYSHMINISFIAEMSIRPYNGFNTFGC